jgi:hypothetical protein
MPQFNGIRRIKDLDNISELERLPPESHNFLLIVEKAVFCTLTSTARFD